MAGARLSFEERNAVCIHLCIQSVYTFFWAILYTRAKKTNLMHCLPSVYSVNQPLHVSGILVAHHQEVHRIYTTIGTYCCLWLTVCLPGCVGTQPGQQTVI